MKERIVHFSIMFVLFLGNGYLLIHFLEERRFWVLILVSLIFAILADQIAKRLASMLFKNKKD